MTNHSEARRSVCDLAHTADAGFTVHAPIPRKLFEYAAFGLMDIVADPIGAVPRTHRHVTAQADDMAELLREFLAALLVLVVSDGCVLHTVHIDVLDATSVAATVVVDDAPDALSSRPYREVKAITWHALAVERRDGGWWARVIVDI